MTSSKLKISEFGVLCEYVISVEEERAKEERNDKKEEKQSEDFYEVDITLVHAILFGSCRSAESVTLDVDFRGNQKYILVLHSESLLNQIHAIPLYWPHSWWNYLKGSKRITNSLILHEKSAKKLIFSKILLLLPFFKSYPSLLFLI